MDSLILGVDGKTPIFKKCSQVPRRGGIDAFLKIWGKYNSNSPCRQCKGRGCVQGSVPR